MTRKHVHFTGTLSLDEEDYKILKQAWEDSDTDEEAGTELFNLMVDFCTLNMITAEPKL